MTKDRCTDHESSSDSDGSDDEYLTGNQKSAGGEDAREAIIRKKLLESFYGKSGKEATTAAASNKLRTDSATESDQGVDEGEEFEDDDINNNDDMSSSVDHPRNCSSSRNLHHQRRSYVGSTNLDSTHFDPHQYAKGLISTSSTEALLIETEKLATDIRGLDSTMQTLVYENYSKFIDATDAIRSIGRSVGASEAGLRLLAESMDRIERGTSSVDTALKASREAVAEKLRVKRHLSRLDALLKLPNTLRTQIATGRYRLAAKSHASASHILSKHSSGFESLSRIETECNHIMSDMAKDLERKLEAWNSNSFRNYSNISCPPSNDAASTDPKMISQPKNVSEIFECAGTLLFLSPASLPCSSSSSSSSSSSMDEGQIQASNMENYRKLALEACTSLLTQMLDTHQKGHTAQRNARERLGSDDSHGASLTSPSSKSPIHAYCIVPQNFFDNMLEAATLFGVTFTDPSSNPDDTCRMLSDFVLQLFSKFLDYARQSLDENIGACVHSSSGLQQQQQQHTNNGNVLLDDGGSKGLPTFEKKSSRVEFNRIVSDLTRLVKAVRELASGLALPEVGLQVEMCGNLVDKTIELCDALIQRYISAHFQELRAKVTSAYLVPFSKNILDSTAKAMCSSSTTRCNAPETATTTTAITKELPSLAHALIGDVMQAADTAISDIASHLFSAPIEHAILQAVVKKKSYEFAFWLASALEVFAGCDDTASGDLVLDATILVDEENDDEIIPSVNTGESCDFNNLDSLFEGRLAVEDWSKLRDLVLYLENSVFIQMENTANTDGNDGSKDEYGSNPLYLTLAVAEACRSAEARVFDSINQSIIAVMSYGSINRDSENESSHVAARFQLAYKRALSLYSSNIGAHAALAAFEEYQMPWVMSNSASFVPNSYACRILQIAKLSCHNCADILGFDPLASEAQSFPEKSLSNLIYNKKSSGFVGNARGLQLDVERMFTEKAPIYSTVEFSRDSVAAAIFRIAFRAIIEWSRVSVFSKYGYQSVQIDTELLRHMIPHYVSSDEADKLFNLLDDVLFNVSERCMEQVELDEDALFSYLMKWWSDNPVERAKFT